MRPCQNFSKRTTAPYRAQKEPCKQCSFSKLSASLPHLLKPLMCNVEILINKRIQPIPPRAKLAQAKHNKSYRRRNNRFHSSEGNGPFRTIASSSTMQYLHVLCISQTPGAERLNFVFEAYTARSLCVLLTFNLFY